MVYLRYNLADGQRAVPHHQHSACGLSGRQWIEEFGLGQAGLELSMISASLVSDLCHYNIGLADCPGKNRDQSWFWGKTLDLRGVSGATLSAGGARGCGAHHTGNASH